MAFTKGPTPVSGDWKTAEWETAGTKRYARCLVGPGGTTTLAKGLWAVWVKLTDNPEIPVKKADGMLEVF
jgi:hypothetical protein